MSRQEDVCLIQNCLEGADDAGWDSFVRTYSRLIWHSIQKTFLTHSFLFSREDVEDKRSGTTNEPKNGI